MVARLDGRRPQPDRPGDLTAHAPADGPSAGVLALLAVQVLRLTARVAEQFAQLTQPGRHVPHRRASDHEQPEAGHQAEQRRRHPWGEPGHQRRGDRVADKPARPPDRRRAVRRIRRALGDTEQPEHADEQGHPADHRARGLRVQLRVTHEPPAEQREQHRDHERAIAEEAAGQVVDQPSRGIAHPQPDPGREYDRQPEAQQPDPVPLVVRMQVPRAAPGTSHRESDCARDQHPARRQGAEHPPGEDDYRVLGRLGLPPLRSAPLCGALRFAECSAFGLRPVRRRTATTRPPGSARFPMPNRARFPSRCRGRNSRSPASRFPRSRCPFSARGARRQAARSAG